MPKVTTCPDLSQYRRLTAGQLSDVEREGLLGHLEGCDACATRLDALPEQDTLVGLIRKGQTLGGDDSGEAVARLVERLSKLRPGDNPAGSGAEPPAAPLTSACPACGKTLKVKGESAGKRGKCPHCQQVAVAAAKSAATPERAPASGASAAAARTTTHAAGRPQNTMDRQPAADPAQGLYDFLAPPQAADELGRLGPYRVLEVLGSGGMGVVFRAEDPQLARLVALKAMLPSLAASANARQRFLREARAAAAIKHDHVVTIYQVGEDRGVPFLAMEFLEGEPLDARLKRQGKLPATEVRRIGREMALGLAAAHKRQLIHRDIKPANIWLEAETGRVKVLDFGLARAIGDDAHLTLSGAIMGTPAYMAPEQAQGKAVDHRCDLFGLGCVLYRLATGEAPFGGADAISTLMAVAINAPRPPHELEPGLPPALSELILCLLAKAPEDRPPSAQAVADALEAIAAEGAAGRPPPSIRPARPGPPYLRTVRLFRKKWPILAGVAACLLLLGVAGLWSAGAFKLKTQDGTIVVDNLPAGAEVVVDGGKISVAAPGDSRPLEIRVAPGKRTLEIKAAGFKMETREVTLASGERGQPIDIRLEPLVVVPDKSLATIDPKVALAFKKGGAWKIEADELVQELQGYGELVFGDINWTDYNFSCESKWVDGSAEHGMAFRYNPSGREVFFLGAWGNMESCATMFRDDRIVKQRRVAAAAVKKDAWNRLSVQVRGRRCECYRDGLMVLQFDDVHPNDLQGQVSLYSHGVARFRKIRVTDPVGKVLFDGIPELPAIKK